MAENTQDIAGNTVFYRAAVKVEREIVFVYNDAGTDILVRPFCKSPKRGAKPAVNALLYTATYGNPLFLFRGNSHLSVPRRWKHPNTARWLWDETEKLLQL